MSPNISLVVILYLASLGRVERKMGNLFSSLPPRSLYGQLQYPSDNLYEDAYRIFIRYFRVNLGVRDEQIEYYIFLLKYSAGNAIIFRINNIGEIFQEIIFLRTTTDVEFF
jgi:hypothetical protein